jgi:UDP-hydrolysing UDP-N-acetyl-D-glucosamine 2-epimerase
VVVTARPSYSRIKTALAALYDRDDVELSVVVAASALLDRYGSAVDTIEAEGFDVTSRVYMVLEGENPTSMAKTTGLGLIELSSVFDNIQPDLVVTVADRYETLATAIGASYMNIPLAHVQGGEITGSIDEKVRHAVTKLADLHLVSTEQAAERVRRMGENPEAVHVTGCPSIDLAREILEDPALDFDPISRYGGVGPLLDVKDGYVVVMYHPVTTEYERARENVEQVLDAIHHIDRPVFWFWPNVDAGADGTSTAIRAYREIERPRHVHFFKNMAPADFLRLLYNASCLVGNSSVGIRECSFLGVPVVNVGSRQTGRDRGGNVIDVEEDSLLITTALEKQMSSGGFASDHLYGDGHAGPRIAELLATLPLSIDKRLTY